MKSDHWQALEPGKFDICAAEAGVDPMWVWADATGYRDHGADRLRDGDALWVVVEKGESISSSDSSFSSFRLTPAQWKDRKTRAGFRQVELAEPVVPERPAPSGRERSARLVPASSKLEMSTADVLVGVIDSGCPFASRFLRDGSGSGTRVLSIWDQDEEGSLRRDLCVPLPDGFGYGQMIARSKLNELMQQSKSPSGSIDEEACYRMAGYRVMRERFSHGAAVISQLFAPSIRGGALQPAPGQPPQWDSVEAKELPIDQAELVFVQIPRAGQQDSTSAALARYVIDGLRYIVSHARKGVTKRIVVNISSGTSRTMHDGSSLLERAIARQIDIAKSTYAIDLLVVVPVGNTNLEQRHGVLSTSEGHLELFLPPDCEMPQYVTVRWPPGWERARLCVTPPGGEPGSVGVGEAKGWPNVLKPQCGVITTWNSGRSSARSLIAFAPTASADPERAVARSGRWTFKLELDGQKPSDELVKFWISRNQRNPGALRRGRQADFVDWDESHSPERYLKLRLDDPDTIKEGIRRAEALSGLATVKQSGFVVVGGYRASDPSRPSKYSADGVTSYSFKSAPCDSTAALPGLTVHGNRSGEVVRVVGTSFAAPLYARALVNRPDPPEASSQIGGKRKRRLGAILKISG